MASWIQGNGKASFLVQAFSFCKLIQNLSPPSFLWTRTTALLRADLLGLMAPTLSMWSRCSFTSSRRPEGMFLGLSLKGLGSVTLVLCSTALVHPILPSSNAKISWYSTSKFRAFSLFSSVQDLRPKSLSSWKRTFLLSLTDSPAHPSLVHLQIQRVSTVPSTTTVPGTSLAVTILATAVPFNRTMG